MLNSIFHDCFFQKFMQIFCRNFVDQCIKDKLNLSTIVINLISDFIKQAYVLNKLKLKLTES